jgi:radical SAM superfamily enzyme YgiQ (UPF0313 family)
MNPFNPVYERLPHLYQSCRMNAPLAEQTPNVVQFELTTGCSHNACTYCDLFKGVKYSAKSERAFKEHAQKVMRELAHRGESAQLERIFIGGGDALSVEFRELQSDIDTAIGAFKYYTGRVPRRITMYASVENILSQGIDGLNHLHCGGKCGNCSKGRWGERRGLELIYLGLETGSDRLLKEIGKGYTTSDMFKAFDILKRIGVSSWFGGSSKLRVSAFVMPGLGGIAHYDGHVQDTVRALNYLKPEFINLTTIKEHPGTAYARRMDKQEMEGTNRRLTPSEVSEQIAAIVEGLFFDTKIGCFDNSCYLGEDTNPLKFPSVALKQWGDGGLSGARLAEQIRAASRERRGEFLPTAVDF